jgi:AraC-like DNA-binding protein
MAFQTENSALRRQLLHGHTWEPVPGVAPCLLCAMKTREPTNIRTRRIIHGHWAIDYPYTTGLEVRTRTASSRWVTRRARVAHLYPPWTTYWERRSGPSRPQFHEEVYILFQGADPLRFLVDRHMGYARLTDPHGSLEELLSEAARIGAIHGENGFWKAQAVLCGIVDLLMTAQRSDKATWSIVSPERHGETTEFVSMVDAYLHNHVSDRVTLKEIARHVHVSDSTLSHRYRAETGRTPMDTLTHLRIEIAKGLLAKGRRLKEVAAQMGFTDAFHLSRTFKSVTGVSPKDFLRHQRAGASSHARSGKTAPLS